MICSSQIFVFLPIDHICTSHMLNKLRLQKSWVTLLNATQRYSTLLYDTLRYDTLRYSTLHYATLRYSALLYATLRYSTLLYINVALYVLLSYGRCAHPKHFQTPYQTCLFVCLHAARRARVADSIL
jgi:hypothetical protein